MAYLAAFAPPHWTVLHVDEAVEPVDLGARADLVAMFDETLEFLEKTGSECCLQHPDPISGHSAPSASGPNTIVVGIWFFSQNK
jgi:hypothetical protein